MFGIKTRRELKRVRQQLSATQTNLAAVQQNLAANQVQNQQRYQQQIDGLHGQIQSLQSQALVPRGPSHSEQIALVKQQQDFQLKQAKSRRDDLDKRMKLYREAAETQLSIWKGETERERELMQIGLDRIRGKEEVRTLKIENDFRINQRDLQLRLSEKGRLPDALKVQFLADSKGAMQILEQEYAFVREQMELQRLEIELRAKTGGFTKEMEKQNAALVAELRAKEHALERLSTQVEQLLSVQRKQQARQAQEDEELRQHKRYVEREGIKRRRELAEQKRTRDLLSEQEETEIAATMQSGLPEHIVMQRVNDVHAAYKQQRDQLNGEDDDLAELGFE